MGGAAGRPHAGRLAALGLTPSASPKSRSDSPCRTLRKQKDWLRDGRVTATTTRWAYGRMGVWGCRCGYPGRGGEGECVASGAIESGGRDDGDGLQRPSALECNGQPCSLHALQAPSLEPPASEPSLACSAMRTKIRSGAPATCRTSRTSWSATTLRISSCNQNPRINSQDSVNNAYSVGEQQLI